MAKVLSLLSTDSEMRRQDLQMRVVSKEFVKVFHPPASISIFGCEFSPKLPVSGSTFGCEVIFQFLVPCPKLNIELGTGS